jgi:ABC-2 type transport system ATP-binding protein
MRRRLLLGKALVHAPQVLVLDEPTAGVDIELRNMLWDNVRMLNRQGMTIILTTHYLQEAEAMCDEIAIIDKGSLIVRDTTKAILARMDAKTLLVRPAAPVGDLSLPEGVTREDRADGWLVLTYPHSSVSTGAILGVLGAAGVEIVDLSTTEPDLEDAFLALTRG